MINMERPDTIRLIDLLSNLKKGVYIIPDFQRDYDWNAQDVRELLKSIFSNYYIGNLLLWKSNDDNKSSFSCEDITGFNTSEKHTDLEYIVLDGQQRLTSLYYAFIKPQPPKGRVNTPKFFLRVQDFLEDDIDNNIDDAIFYETFPNKLQQLSNVDYLVENQIFPLANIFDNLDDDSEWFEHFSDKYGREYRKKFKTKLRDIIEHYEIVYIKLADNISADRVCDIFEKLNSNGKRLNTFDLLNSILKKHQIQLRTDLWESAEIPFVDESTRIYILQCMSIIKQAYCAPKYLYYLLPGIKRQTRDSEGNHEVVLVNSADEFKTLWSIAVEQMSLSCDKLKAEYGILGKNYLPYKSMQHVFSAINYFAFTNGLGTDINRKRIMQWWFASIITQRYSSTVDSLAAQDYQDMTKWLRNDNNNRICLEIIPAALNRMHGIDFFKENRPGTALYNLILNLILKNEARDFYSGQKPQLSILNDHHIVPKSKADKVGVGKDINTILNRTLISNDTNGKILDRMPQEYLADIRNYKTDSFQEIMDSHFISSRCVEILMQDNFSKDDFREFASERQKMIIEYIVDKIF